MEHRDSQQPFADGVDCAVCGRIVPAEGIRVLAQRDDLVFVELACESCRSESLGIIVEGVPGAESYGEFVAADHVRFHEALPIGVDDILTVRALLAGGDLDGLVRGPGEAGGRPG